MLIVAGFFIWGGIAIVGIALIVLSILVVVIDSWANRPVRNTEDRYDEDPLTRR
jgi:hypothetical protein